MKFSLHYHQLHIRHGMQSWWERREVFMRGKCDQFSVSGHGTKICYLQLVICCPALLAEQPDIKTCPNTKFVHGTCHVSQLIFLIKQPLLLTINLCF